MSLATQRHPAGNIYLLLTSMFGNAMYYGVRSLIIAYLLTDSFEMSRVEALSHYGTFSYCFIVAAVLGALLGDLLLGWKKSVYLGITLSLVGIGLISFSNISMLIFGAILCCFGSAFISANINAIFASRYIGKDDIADAGFTIFHLFINFGSFLGVYIINSLYIENSIFAIVSSMIFILFAFLSFYFSKTPLINFSEKVKTVLPEKRYIPLFIIVLFIAIYNVGYEIGYKDFVDIQFDTLDLLDIEIRNLEIADYIFLVAFCILYYFLWSKYTLSRILKLAIGFILSAILYFIITQIIFRSDGVTSIYLLGIVFLLYNLAEFLIVPLIKAEIVKNWNLKFLATTLAFIDNIPALLAIAFSFYLKDEADLSDMGSALHASGWFLFFAFVLGCIYFVRPKTKIITELIDSED